LKSKEPFILTYEGEIFITNPYDEEINSLEYSTKSIQFFDDDIIHSSCPFYKIEHIPKNSMVKIEKVDKYEDGVIIYCLEKLELDIDNKTAFKSFRMNKKIYKDKSIFRKDGSEKFFKVTREKTLLKTKPCYVVDEDGDIRIFDEENN